MSETFTKIVWTKEIVARPLMGESAIASAEMTDRVRRAVDDSFRAILGTATVNAPPPAPSVLTEGHLRDLMRAVFKPVYRVSEHVPQDAMYKINPQPLYYGHQPERMIIVGKRAARAIDWETYAKQRWAGRDRRRIKRERRRYVMEGKAP